MNFIEREIISLNRRVEKIKRNPDPTKPQANVLLYELERDFRIAQLDAWKSGAKFAASLSPVLTGAMGFWFWDGIMAADRTHGDEAQQYFNLIRSKGLPEQACDRCVISIPMVDIETFPKPDLVVNCNYECAILPLCYNLIGKKHNIPTCHVDVKFEKSEENLSYIVAQMEEMIEYAEKNVPGIKFDLDRLIELQYWEKQWCDAWSDIYELRKKKPCPIAGREAFREPRQPSMYHDPARAVKYLQEYRDELGEWAQKGRGAVTEEKLRLVWAVSGPFFADPFKLLEQRGVAVPWWQIAIASRFASVTPCATYGDEKEYGRKLTPMEEEARVLGASSWGGLGKRWIDDCITNCRNIGAEGLIYFVQWGCTVTNSLGRLVADEVEKQLGIPTLILEGRMLDSEVFDQIEFETTLNEFVDLCLDRKGL